MTLTNQLPAIDRVGIVVHGQMTREESKAQEAGARDEAQGLKQSTLRGGLARVVSQAASFVLRIGSLLVLARLLNPTDFGLVGMVTVVTGVFGLFRDAGLSMVTIQRSSISEAEISALFWLNMLVGTVLALLCAAAAPGLVAFYHEPRLLWVTLTLAAGFLFNAAGVQHCAVLQRQMRFGALALADIAALVVSTAVGIGMAIGGYGYWALVGMGVTLPAVSTFGYWMIGPWWPGMPKKVAGIGSMIKFGGAMTLNGVIVYVAYNTDKVLLGRIWGAETLGLYGRAFQLINIPTDNLNSAVGSVAVSALSKLQDSPERFRSYFLKGYALLVALTIPITVACFLFATDIVAVLLGQKWLGVAPIFRLLAPTILALALINPVTWVLFAMGRVRRSLHMAFVIAPVVVTGYIAGLPYGPQGVALGYSVMMALLTVPMILWALKGSVVHPGQLLRAVRPPVLSALLGGVAGFAVASLMGNESRPLVRLVAEVSAMTAAYLASLLYLTGQKDFYFGLIRDLRGGAAAASHVAP